MKLELNGQEWHATAVDENLDYGALRNCIITSSRPTLSIRLGYSSSE